MINTQFSSIYSFSWHKTSIRLQNTRNTFAKRHPCFIFHAIFLSAAKGAGLTLDEGFCFHPVGQPLPDRMYKKLEFTLELVFPTFTRNDVERFLDGLTEHLINPANNFSLISIGPVQQRSLADIEREFLPEDSWKGQEICLEFLTPFSFIPKAANRNWLISRDDFFKALCKRIQHLTALLPNGVDNIWQDIRLLPYYWQFNHNDSKRSSSNEGNRSLAGVTGPLYLRGDILSVMPLLLFCSELHISSMTRYGQKTRLGQGYYILKTRRPYFDTLLADFEVFTGMARSLEQQSDLADELAETFLDRPAAMRELHAELTDGRYEIGPATGFYVDKRHGGKRLIATFEARDYLAHKFLHHILSSPMDKMFEDASVGFRQHRSRETARKMIREACSEGCRYVLESDVESFFDCINWDIMLRKLRDHIPLEDTITLAYISHILKGPLNVSGNQLQRDKGVITGSPLSPLLANLYLDSFDEEMEKEGFRLIRYGDDFLVLTRTREEAEHALRTIEKILSEVKLAIKDEKTSTTQVDLGFSFLGLAFDADMDEDYVEGVSLSRPLYIRNQYSFVGVDGNTIVIRKNGALIANFPINHISEIVVLGNNTLSSRLLQRCTKDRIPVSFCSPMGWYYSTLKPDSRAHYLLSRLHAQMHEELSADAQTEIAARIVMAKLHNYIYWFRERWPAEAKEVIQSLETTLAQISKTDQISRVRGFEGEAARKIFFLVNRFCKSDFFHSSGRIQRRRQDPYNCLLDFGYSLLFTRLNVLLRGQGLNPYLGVLHSTKDTYESLVCDLQEPFRCRIDRFIVKAINRSILQEKHFEIGDNGKFSMTGTGVGLYLEAFEREMGVRLAGDGGTFGQLLAAQVRALRSWVEGKFPLHFYRAGTQPGSSRKIRSIIPQMPG